MDVALTLEKIEVLSKAMYKADSIERLHFYSTIKTILNDLKRHTKTSEDLKNTPNVDIYFTELEMPLQGLAGFVDYGHMEESYYSWLTLGINKLRSVHCYNLD